MLVERVAELTRSAGIQVNGRLLLRRHPGAISLAAPGHCPQSPDVPQAKPSGDHTPLGGFVLRKTMTNSKASQHTTAAPGFKIVCEICDGLGIVFDCAEDAPATTQIRCRHCGASRGTLGELRDLSASGQHDLFEI